MNLRLLRAVDRWRAQFNPLRGLTTQRAVTLLDEGEGGCYADLQWTYRRVEKREPTLRGLKRLRQAAVAKLDWQIRTKDDSPEAKRQADALRAAYDAIGNLNAAIRFLALAEFRGYAHLEKIYRDDDPAQGIVELCPVEQWHWVRDGLYGAWQYNAAATQVTRGADIDPAHFVIREVDDPINEIGLLLFVEKALSKRDWVGFVEVFGIPPLFAKLPPNIPQGEEAKYQEMAEAVVSDMRGVLPNGAEVTTVDAGARGANPFRDHIAYLDEQLVLAGTSGKLAMLTASTGMNSGQADAHDAVFDRLAAAEAAEIAEVLQRSIDAPLLRAKFPGAPALAWFAFDTEDEESANSVLTNAKLAKEAGFSADAAQLSEKTGLKLTRNAEGGTRNDTPPSLRPSSFVPPATLNRDPAPSSGSEFRAPSSAFLAAVGAQAAPVVDLLENLPDPETDPEGYRAKLAELRERLPELMDPAGIAEALAEDMLSAGARASSPASDTAPTTSNAFNPGQRRGSPDNKGRWYNPDGSPKRSHAPGHPDTDFDPKRAEPVKVHAAVAEALGAKEGIAHLDAHSLWKKHPYNPAKPPKDSRETAFRSADEARAYVRGVLENPTHIVPGNRGGTIQVIQARGGRTVAVEVHRVGGMYRVKSAHTLPPDRIRDVTGAPGAKAIGPTTKNREAEESGARAPVATPGVSAADGLSPSPFPSTSL